MWAEWIKELAEHHPFKVLGALTGLVLALMVMRFGLGWTLFIALCTGLGIWVGKRLDEGPESLLKLLERLERLLTPGGRN